MYAYIFTKTGFYFDLKFANSEEEILQIFCDKCNFKSYTLDEIFKITSIDKIENLKYSNSLGFYWIIKFNTELIIDSNFINEYYREESFKSNLNDEHITHNT